MYTTASKKILKKIKYLTLERPRFKRFESLINPDTIRISKSYENSTFEIQKRSIHPAFEKIYNLHQERLRDTYLDRYNSSPDRVLVHVPPLNLSAGGNSLFLNLVSGLKDLGVSVRTLAWNDDVLSVLKEFKPTIFLSSDSPAYLSRIPWTNLKKHVDISNFKIGLTASLERYGSGPLVPRLQWARENGISFYYSFRAPEYIKEHYHEYFLSGFPVFSVEFGANHNLFYPIRTDKKDLDYSFFASSNHEKWSRYFQYLNKIFQDYKGLINGPGWNFISTSIPQKDHVYFYGRTRVGINLHIDDSILFKSELNERTYILAACGVPQLVDNPLLLSDRFSPDCFYISRNPEEYNLNFERILKNQEEALAKSLIAYDEVMNKHTTLERARSFLSQLKGFSMRSSK